MNQNPKLKALFLFEYYSMNVPTIMVANGILHKICNTRVPAFWMSFNEQLDRLDHFRRHPNGSILLDQRTTSAPTHITLT
jgi:hypothetical protein